MQKRIESAMKALEVAREKAEKDHNRPVFHYRPLAQWMNDVCGAIHYKGWYHIFHMFDPHHEVSRHNGWGHARSRDLVHWEHLPVAIMPDFEKEELLYGSGSVVLDDKGVPILFFAWTPNEWKEKKRQQRAAVPIDDELIKWEILEIGLRPGESGVPADIRFTWADMFVFRANNRTFATFKSSKGLVCEALNPELTRWQAVGNIQGVIGECPNFFPLEDKWVLIQSMHPISYQVGQFNPDSVRFTPDGPARTLDYVYGPEAPALDSRGLYGTTVTTDEQGRTLFFGRVSGFEPGHGWNGCMSLPRVLSFDDDGNLIQTPVPELEQLREKLICLQDLKLDNMSRKLDEIAGDTIEIRATIIPGDARAFGICLRCADNSREGVVIACQGGKLNVAGTEVPDALSVEDNELNLHLYIDKSVLEAFIDRGRKTVTRVIEADPQNLRISLFAEGGIATFREIEVWLIKRVWPR